MRVELGGTGLESGFAAFFFNPREPDLLTPATCRLVSGTKYRFDNPQGQQAVGSDDWVLAILAGTGIPCSGAKAGLEGVVAWIERDPVTGAAQVLALDISPAGAAEREPNRLDHEGTSVPRRSRVGCTPSAACVVAWEEEDRLTGEVTARYVTMESQAVRLTSDELVLRSASGELWLGRPELDSQGRIVLTWEEFDASGESRGRFAAFAEGSSD